MQVAASIREFGWTNPVLVDGDNGIIAGHGRVLAALKLGMDEVPTIELAYLSEVQKQAYILADNQLATNASWDNGLLMIEIDDLKELDFDINLLGFSDDELNKLRVDDINEGLTDDDDVPDVPEVPVTVLGDVWVLGNHRLMCGDSTNEKDIKKLVGSESIDLVVFDPPYEMENLYDNIPSSTKYNKLIVFWDFKRFGIAPHKAIQAGWKPQFEFIWDCVQSWFTPNRPLQRHKACGYFCDDPYFNTDDSIIKDGKDRGNTKQIKNTRGSYEYTPLDGAVHIRTVEQFSNASMSNDGHKHGKPSAWIEAIFKGVQAESVFSMFGGSGTDLIIAEKIGIQCYMMELDPAYCDVIINRWQLFTGNKAALLNNS